MTLGANDGTYVFAHSLEWTTPLKTHLTTFLGLAILTLLGCETRVDADSRGDGGTEVVRDRDPGVDADINLMGLRGNTIRIDVDEDRREGTADNDVDVRVDADRPLRRDEGDVRVRETRRGVRVDVKD